VHGAAIVSKLRGCRTPHKSGEVCARTPPKKKPVIRRAVKEKIRFFCSFRLFCLPILPSPPFWPRIRDLLQLPPPSLIWGSIEVGDGVSLRYRRFPFQFLLTFLLIASFSLAPVVFTRFIIRYVFTPYLIILGVRQLMVSFLLHYRYFR
jgi:hypothetical protein